MTDPVTGWFEITQYNDNRVILIANLAENTWLTRYPRPVEIMYDQGSKFIDHEFRKYLNEKEYEITAKPNTSVNPTSNEILEHIHQVLVNLVRTFNIRYAYVDKYDPWSGMLTAAAFANCSKEKRLKI